MLLIIASIKIKSNNLVEDGVETKTLPYVWVWAWLG